MGLKIVMKKVIYLTILVNMEANNIAKKNFCKRSAFPIKYLGVPLNFSKLKRKYIQHIVDKIIKKVAGWRGRLLSYGRRLTLLRSCLASILIYPMSFIEFPKWDIDVINSQMAHFFWNNTEDRQSYHLPN